MPESHIDRKASSQFTKKRGFQLFLTLPILSWALYDLANTIFSSNMVTIFFPFYLQEAVGDSERMNQIASTFISYANAASSLLLVIFTPLFGVLIDRTGKKKRYITWFTLICVFCTLLMGLIAGAGISGTVNGLSLSLLLVILLFVIASFFYSSGLVFYDTILADLGTKETIPVISGFGIAVGYVGTIVGLSVYPFVGEDFHRAFIPTALLFLLFSLPLMIGYKEAPFAGRGNEAEKKSFFSGYKEIIETVKEIRLYRPAFLFMLTYFFLNDSISTAIAMMAVYAKAVIGFSSGEFILLYLVSTFACIIGSFIFGYVTKTVGAKKAVTYVGILLIIALALAVFAVASWIFWITGALFGVALGACWVTSRTLIIELTPPHKRGQFFGLFAFSGKVSSVIGPLLYGSITWIFADWGNTASRMALGSLMLLAIVGLFIHRGVKSPPESQHDID
ncbi:MULTISPECIES: MFS transporter [Bacillus]|uniref:MFS transporter n=2 Tax=Bacillus TaxID=1386 RepID=A0A0M4FI54_9BACI|nr:MULTISPECIES: MFS transporter [Bacillus]ALC80879.1 MFS transporter [Bacillus gobiensis]MBP1079819.1 UMF1 family MFS transporter [Bacillus capparidis]MED1095208.1 MFS transporter [Bacillus capparidis]